MITREQERARRAYECVAQIGTSQRDDYKIAVNAIGANVVRSGLAAAMSWLERDKSAVTEQLLDHLAGIGILGVGEVDGAGLPAAIRELPADRYMLATRDLLKIVIWFRRAVQATFV